MLANLGNCKNRPKTGPSRMTSRRQKFRQVEKSRVQQTFVVALWEQIARRICGV
jgi:hypothetical protein